MTVIFGQEDYVLRIMRYMEKLHPAEELRALSFPLPCNDPAGYVFDFSLHDDVLRTLKRDTKIIIAFNAKQQSAASRHIDKCGFINRRIFDAAVDNEFRIKYFTQEFAETGKEFSVIGKRKSVVVYMAKSHVDKPLRGNFTPSAHIVPIQVGAALTDKRIAAVTDDTGDNISARNRHYSEVTALYWMWKNATADYLGLCHYRRVWKDLEIVAAALQSDLIDAVLPLPTLFPCSVLDGQFRKFTPQVWETTLDILRETHPEYDKRLREILMGHTFYSCNMFIVKHDVLDDLCEFMFPILFEIEQHIGDLDDPYYNRYAGFCAEQIITLYFLSNKRNWRISHAEKIFLG